jgi:hypothetical protein
VAKHADVDQFVVVGHSLGGATASLCALDLCLLLGGGEGGGDAPSNAETNRVVAYLLGAPAVAADKATRDFVHAVVGKHNIIRQHHQFDPVSFAKPTNTINQLFELECINDLVLGHLVLEPLAESMRLDLVREVTAYVMTVSLSFSANAALTNPQTKDPTAHKQKIPLPTNKRSHCPQTKDPTAHKENIPLPTAHNKNKLRTSLPADKPTSQLTNQPTNQLVSTFFSPLVGHSVGPTNHRVARPYFAG